MALRWPTVFSTASCIALGACSGGSGGGAPVAAPPAPPPPVVVAPPPPVVVTPAPTAQDYDTLEYRRSNAAVQAQALPAYNAGVTGAGVVVGVIDSGVAASNPEFAGRISPLSGDFAGARGIEDEDGHGTAVASVLLGAKNDSGAHGLAFGATLLALRTDTPGSCTKPATATDESGCSHNDNAIARALDQAVVARARVVNISLGGSSANSNLRAAVNRATAAGTIIVFSAGNEGVDDPAAAVEPDPFAQVANDPGARGLVIIAGAVDGAGASASFSNKAGSSATAYITALGVRVRTINEQGQPILASGTSFSAPAVAGAAALIAQAFPNLSATQIVRLLYDTATDRGDAGVDAIYGNGEINLARAFQPQGATSLAVSGVPVSLTTNATLAAPMGDAGKQGFTARIEDGYARGFEVELGDTLRPSVPAPALAAALAHGVRAMSAAGGGVSMAVSVAERPPLALGESRDRRDPLGVLAGAVVANIDSRTTLGIGIARSAGGLVDPVLGPQAPAFLLDASALDRATRGGAALRHSIGGVGVTVAAESGDLRLWERGAAPADDRWQRFGNSQIGGTLDASIGPLAVKAGGARVVERETVLGSRLGPALGGGGAVTWFADVAASVTPLDGWTLAASWRRGWTRLAASPARGQSDLYSRSLAIALHRSNLLVPGDRFGVQRVEPLRVYGGGVNLGAAGALLSLAAVGRERNLEVAYTLPLPAGEVSINAFQRRQPGNIAAAPDDTGAALRFTLGF